jgi:hypothetical protein
MRTLIHCRQRSTLAKAGRTHGTIVRRSFKKEIEREEDRVAMGKDGWERCPGSWRGRRWARYLAVMSARQTGGRKVGLKHPVGPSSIRVPVVEASTRRRGSQRSNHCSRAQPSLSPQRGRGRKARQSRDGIVTGRPTSPCDSIGAAVGVRVHMSLRVPTIHQTSRREQRVRRGSILRHGRRRWHGRVMMVLVGAKGEFGAQGGCLGWDRRV